MLPLVSLDEASLSYDSVARLPNVRTQDSAGFSSGVDTRMAISLCR